MQQSSSTVLNVANHQHAVTMSSREIAELTGKRHPDVKRDIEVMLDQLSEDVSNFARIYFDTMNRQQTEYQLDRRHVECLLTGYNAVLRMKVIDRMHELESGKELVASPALADSLLFVEVASRILHLPQSGALGMLRKAGDAHMLPDLLPAYAIDSVDGGGSSDATFALTTLLKMTGITSSAASVNKLLEKAGIIQKMKRPSSKGGEKEFWNVTDAGLRFGKNVTSDRNPRETQPHFYKSQFGKMLAAIGI
ncbi:Rha family transcriptional regulator [Citrobacter braakii]